MNDHDRTLLDRVTSIYATCADLSPGDQLEVLEVAWLCVASYARTEASGTPGGFRAEQARQSGRLARMAALVSAEVPDPEMARLYHERDIDGMVRHVQQIRAERGTQ